jgi:predicted ATP-grasp superfamily ATP-dependent carboligase
MARILLTGGRAPAALELARFFHTAGHQVFMAESMRRHLARPSRAIVRNYLVPPPNRVPDDYIEALRSIVCQEAIDLLLPTCEEIFWVAKGRERLADHCTVFTEGIERLRQLHHKGFFACRARSYGLSVPKTVLLETPDDLRALMGRGWDEMAAVVLKPAYSRFATRTIILAQGQTGKGVEKALNKISPASPWVAQQFIRGQQLCTYSVAHAGQLAAHTTYAVEFRSGLESSGHPAIAFQHLDHAPILAWVRRFVEQERFSGQIAFDFIEGEGGDEPSGLFAIECNPRATSGIHLFAGTPDFVDVFLGARPGPWLTPLAERPSLLAAAMLCYALPATRSWAALRHWLVTMRAGRDVIFSLRDPLPALLQGVAIAELMARAWRLGLSPVEASTHDIEWNGE